MIVGECPKAEDISVNVCKKKQLTNMRASGSDEALRLVPPKVLSLEQCLEFLADDELLECTRRISVSAKRLLDHGDPDAGGFPKEVLTAKISCTVF